ncbi:MAG: YbaK/EbsC family protein [Myxococcales bacterium]|nr:YbaK/EbsC family protein [Myxococcales bacterium]
MAIAVRVRKLLDDNGIKYLHTVHSPAYTASEVAQAAHIKGRAFAKTVVIRTPKGGFALVVVSANDLVSLEALGKEMGAEAPRLATEAEFERLFPGIAVGAMSPFGNLYDLPVYVDRSVAEQKEIAFNAGTHRDVVQMAYADFERLAKPKVGAFVE